MFIHAIRPDHVIRSLLTTSEASTEEQSAMVRPTSNATEVSYSNELSAVDTTKSREQTDVVPLPSHTSPEAPTNTP